MNVRVSFGMKFSAVPNRIRTLRVQNLVKDKMTNKQDFIMLTTSLGYTP